MKAHSFRRVSGNSLSFTVTLCCHKKFPQQEIKWIFGILRSVYLNYISVPDDENGKKACEDAEVKDEEHWQKRALQRGHSSEAAAKKGVFKNFSKFSRKHLCQSLFFNKVAGLKPATLLKRDMAQVFLYEFYKIFKSSFFIKHLRWLRLTPWFYLSKVGF